MRVATYIDGFNLYHAIADLNQPHLKWLNLQALSESFLLAGETLVSANYFSAFATWLPGPYKRHRAYVNALRHYGVLVCMGKFKDKPRRCAACHANWISHEEKETDVNVSIRLVADALRNEFDRAILISADSDLGPAVRLVQNEAKKPVLVVAPPGRLGHARELKPKLEVTLGRLRANLLPAVLYDANGNVIVQRPAEYDPPTIP